MLFFRLFLKNVIFHGIAPKSVFKSYRKYQYEEMYSESPQDKYIYFSLDKNTELNRHFLGKMSFMFDDIFNIYQKADSERIVYLDNNLLKSKRMIRVLNENRVMITSDATKASHYIFSSNEDLYNSSAISSNKFFGSDISLDFYVYSNIRLVKFMYSLFNSYNIIYFSYVLIVVIVIVSITSYLLHKFITFYENLDFWVTNAKGNIVLGREPKYWNPVIKNMVTNCQRSSIMNKENSILYIQNNQNIEEINNKIPVLHCVYFKNHVINYIGYMDLIQNYSVLLNKHIQIGDDKVQTVTDNNFRVNENGSTATINLCVEKAPDLNMCSSNVGSNFGNASVNFPMSKILVLYPTGIQLSMISILYDEIFKYIGHNSNEYIWFDYVSSKLFECLSLSRLITIKYNKHFSKVIVNMRSDSLFSIDSKHVMETYSKYRNAKTLTCLSDSAFSDCQGTYVFSQSYVASDVVIVIGVNYGDSRLFMENYLFSYVIKLYSSLFQIPDSMERNLRHERLAALFTYRNIQVFNEVELSNYIKDDFSESERHKIVSHTKKTSNKDKLGGHLFTKLDGSFNNINFAKSEDNVTMETLDLAFIEDVTHVKQQEQKIKQLNLDLKYAFDSLSLNTISLKNGMIELEDQFYSQIGHGLEVEFSDIIHPRDKERVLQELGSSDVTICPSRESGIDTNLKSNNIGTTFQLSKGDHSYSWFSIIAEDQKGFILPVDTLTKLKTEFNVAMETIEKNGLLPSPGSFWLVGTKSRNFVQLLSFRTPFQLIDINDDSVDNLIYHISEGSKEYRYFLDHLNDNEYKHDIFDILMDNKWYRFCVARTDNKFFSGLLSDITNQKEIEEKLRSTSKLRDLVLNDSKITIWTYDGVTKPNILNSIEFSNILDEHFQNRQPIRSTINVGQKWISIRGKYENDMLMGVLCDVTDLHCAAEDLETSRLQTEEAFIERSMFLQKMAHEIRTPLNGIFCMIEMLSSQNLSVSQRHYINTLKLFAFHLMKELKGILYKSRANGGALTNMSTIDPVNLLETIVLNHLPYANSKNIELIVYVNPNIPLTVQCECQIFIQIATNLISNAIKFTNNGSVNISLSFSDEILTMIVADTGCGILDEDLPFIYNKFHFGGIGLSLVNDMVDIVGGKIHVNTKAGVGSTFTVELPFQSVYVPFALKFAVDHHIVFLTEKNKYLEEIVEYYHYKVTYVSCLDDIKKLLAKKLLIDLVIVDHAKFPLSYNDVKTSLDGYDSICAIQPPVEAGYDHIIRKPIFPRVVINILKSIRSKKSKIIDTNDVRSICKKKILIVEDNKTNQFVLKKMLAKLEYDFEVAENGQIAIDLFFNSRFDLVFMDCHMPVMDGLEATRIIRSRENNIRVPIIALTAGATDNDQEMCLESGMDDYLAKPVVLSQIKDTIVKWTISNSL